MAASLSFLLLRPQVGFLRLCQCKKGGNMENGVRFSRLQEDRKVVERTLRLVKLYKGLYNLKNIDSLVSVLEKELRRIDRKIAKLSRTGVIL